jgi:hypothetical protein
MVPTLVFWLMFLYWYKASLANLPFFWTTDCSTSRSITGSRDAMGTFRERLDVICSWRRTRAAWDWPTPISSWARFKTFSGFWCGGGGMLGKLLCGTYC